MSMFDLTGTVAIVTGLSRGLGSGIALALAEAGADIFGVSTKGAPETGANIQALGRRYAEICADLSEADAPEKIVEACIKAYGRVDILVNNAGAMRRAPAYEMSEKDWDHVVDVNLKSVFFLAQAAAKRMKEHGGGKIINLASMLSYQGGINVAGYTASKGGVKSLTMLLANEWAKDGISVNAIAPGYMATDMTEAIQNDPIRNSDILARIPKGRWGTPQDLGGAAVFLASHASDYVTGITIPVDGGWLAR